MNKILFAAMLFTRTQVMMGDVPVTIHVRAPESKKIAAFEAMNEAFKQARKIEQEVSEFKPDSQTSRLNRNAGLAPVIIGKHLLKILETAQQLSLATDGAFDVTFASSDKTATFRDIKILDCKPPLSPPFFKGGGGGTPPLLKRGGRGGFSGIVAKKRDKSSRLRNCKGSYCRSDGGCAE